MSEIVGGDLGETGGGGEGATVVVLGVVTDGRIACCK